MGRKCASPDGSHHEVDDCEGKGDGRHLHEHDAQLHNALSSTHAHPLSIRSNLYHEATPHVMLFPLFVDESYHGLLKATEDSLAALW
jgi:hypothetical protein